MTDRASLRATQAFFTVRAANWETRFPDDAPRFDDTEFASFDEEDEEDFDEELEEEYV